MCGFAAGFKKGGAAGAFGHTFGVKVQRVQRVQKVAVGAFGAIIYAAYGGPLHHFVDLSPLQAGGTSSNKYSCKVFYKRAPSINERRPTLISAKRHL